MRGGLRRHHPRGSHRAQDINDFYLQPSGGSARQKNTESTRSTRLARRYEPGVWLARVSPTPLHAVRLGWHFTEVMTFALPVCAVANTVPSSEATDRQPLGGQVV